MKKISIIKPDDWHVHFRDQDKLSHTVTATAASFSRALVMPNLQKPLTSVDMILEYRKRIKQHIPANNSFTPYMSLYINESLKAESFIEALSLPFLLGAKLYPAGATFNSELGPKSLLALYPLFAMMQELDLVLQIHGETTSGDIFEREARFIDEELLNLIDKFPKLRIVLEHISTSAAVDFIIDAPKHIAATITPHHLLYNRNHLLVGGIRPHYYCLPILKHEKDQLAIQKAATSGNPKFFAGTDSAPHTIANKESSCGCAGIYSAPYALQMYTQIFENLGKLNKLEKFTSVFGANFYKLHTNIDKIELIKKPFVIPEKLPMGDEYVIPIAAGETLKWSINE